MTCCRFIFGVNGELRNNLYLIDEHKLLYTAGHNIVVYSTDEKQQYFLQGKLLLFMTIL